MRAMSEALPQRVLLTGGTGQLGVECQLQIPDGVTVFAPDLDELDLADAASIRRVVADCEPDLVLHVGAWTAVDAAEEQEELATAVNGQGSAVLAEEIAQRGGRLIYVSTDYVFSGEGDRPWQPEDPVDPVNAYGRSKLAGEQAVQQALGDRAQIVRTSWVYGRRGNNFVRTMVNLMRQGRDLKVVADQHGAPTWAGGLAAALWALAAAPLEGPVLHYSDAGITTWHEFAAEIRALALGAGLDVADSSVAPCPSSEYPTPARRPRWSPLACSSAWQRLGVAPQPWQETLRFAFPLLLAEDARNS